MRLKENRNRKQRWFHATSRRFRNGQRIGINGELFLTSSPEPHYTILCEALAWDWHIYEVSPVGKLQFGRCYDEAIAESGIVTRYVGKARGISRNGKVASLVTERRPRLHDGPNIDSRKDLGWKKMTQEEKDEDYRWTRERIKFLRGGKHKG